MKLVRLSLLFLFFFAINAHAAGVLGTASTFAVLAGSTATNTGATVLYGDLGLYPGTSITGFPPGIVNDGVIHTTDAVAMQAQANAQTAYNYLASLPPNQNITGQDLGGLTLTPGVYKFDSSAQLIFTGSFDGPVTWTLLTLADGTHIYTLTGTESGTWVTGATVTGVGVQLTANTGEGFYNSSTRISSGDTDINDVPCTYLSTNTSAP